MCKCVYVCVHMWVCVIVCMLTYYMVQDSKVITICTIVLSQYYQFGTLIPIENNCCSTTGAACKHTSWTAAVIQVYYIIRFLDFFNPFIAIRTPYGVSRGITHLRICLSVCYSLLCVAAASVLILKRSQLHGASYYVG